MDRFVVESAGSAEDLPRIFREESNWMERAERDRAKSRSAGSPASKRDSIRVSFVIRPCSRCWNSITGFLPGESSAIARLSANLSRLAEKPPSYRDPVVFRWDVVENVGGSFAAARLTDDGSRNALSLCSFVRLYGSARTHLFGEKVLSPAYSRSFAFTSFEIVEF